MSTPIKREDIRKGDIIRFDNPYGRDTGTLAIECVAEENGEPDSYCRATALFLIERPVVLPTVPGYYADNDGNMWRLQDGEELEYLEGGPYLKPQNFAPFTLLRPVAEVAAEVLAVFTNLDDKTPGWTATYTQVTIDNIARKFGVTN